MTLSLPELRDRIAAARAMDAPVLLLPDEAEALRAELDAAWKRLAGTESAVRLGEAELVAAEEANQQLRAALGNLFGDLYLHHLGEITDAQLWASGEREETAVRSLASLPGETKEPA